ncbi:MAG: hypothetical protein P9L91_02150 [Candidatus Zophobacter franzmannii]|jgi:hypothetical protein|nr:hypothetical protein [Candidatus Zophobacter franzmannii]
MAHLLFLGYEFKASDPQWSIINAASMDDIYNYLTQDSLIFIHKDKLEDLEIYRRLLLIKLANPYTQIFCVGGFAKYDSKHFIKIDALDIEMTIQDYSKRVYKLNDSRKYLRDLSEEILKER